MSEWGHEWVLCALGLSIMYQLWKLYREAPHSYSRAQRRRQVNWTIFQYPSVREHLSADARAVFDRMAYEGLRLREAAEDLNVTPLLARWRRAIQASGVTSAPAHRLRHDYITAALGALKGDDK